MLAGLYCLLWWYLPCLPSPGFLGVCPHSSFSTASSLAVLISSETACSTAASVVGSQYYSRIWTKRPNLFSSIRLVSDLATAVPVAVSSA